ncbi:MAG: hypothetical protein MUC56_16225 [Thermoanaerobaculales bacterium]|jgi:hypothetical protein|nr:hypothetical protein [Thermoanaerobaculales bacterium]
MRTTTVLAITCIAFGAMFPSTTAVAAETAVAAVAAVAEPPAPTKAGWAGVCQIGPGLASTLLVPYFEVDLTSPIGLTTLISVNSGLSGRSLARLVVWTDWGVPTLAFDIFLEPFDVQTINVRSLFLGEVPATGVGVDLSAFPFCESLPPTYANPALTAGQVEQLRTAHTGQPGHIDGLCYGADHGDQRARGFITVDVVDECSGLEGFEPMFTPVNTTYPYFADGGGSGGIAIADNRLWGDVIYIDDANNFAQATEAVALWADDAEFPGADVFTFYGRHSGWDGRDERVPLPWRWDQRFLNGGPFAGGADLIVFQQPDSAEADPVSCGSTPSWYPLETSVATIDEDAGNILTFGTEIFPLATQRVPISTIGPPYDFGWVQIEASLRQMWVLPSLSAGGRFSAGFNGFPVNFLCSESPVAE